jgi:2-polyprenyl-3-methyl-5-hydroxy-6-metoxy-1,4-benzoquinol methylase
MPVSGAKSGLIPCNFCGGFIFKSALECEGFNFVRCTKCSLVQRNPQPVKEEILARYSKIYGNNYLSYELENEAAFLKLQQLALQDAGFDKTEKAAFLRAKTAGNDSSVLDIGCATGALLASLRDRGWRVTGVEISPSAEYAQKERGLDVRNIPLEEINFPDESFDVIHASHLVEHLNDPRSFFSELRRILKKDGKIFITTPNISGFQARLFGGRWRSAIFDHLYLFSKRTLINMLKICGFKTEGVYTWGGLAAGIAPAYIKKPADFLVKRLGFGDVMIVRSGKAFISARNTHSPRACVPNVCV